MVQATPPTQHVLPSSSRSRLIELVYSVVIEGSDIRVQCIPFKSIGIILFEPRKRDTHYNGYLPYQCVYCLTSGGKTRTVIKSYNSLTHKMVNWTLNFSTFWYDLHFTCRVCAKKFTDSNNLIAHPWILRYWQRHLVVYRSESLSLNCTYICTYVLRWRQKYSLFLQTSWTTFYC